MSSRLYLRLSAAVLAVAVGVVLASTGRTFSGFTVAVVHNSGQSVATANVLAIGNSYSASTCNATGSTSAALTSCAGSVYPTTVGGSAVTDTVANIGTLAATAQYRIASCGPVQLANSRSGAFVTTASTSSATGASGPMLPRGGVGFAATGPAAGMSAITLDGSTGTYAASIGNTTEPVAANASYGLGVWFKTSASGLQPLLSFSQSATNDPSAKTDRILYLNNGAIGFVQTTGDVVSRSLSSTTFNNGAWHFAWVSLKVTVGLLASWEIYVDGAGVPATAVGASLGNTFVSYSGWWHAGWARLGTANTSTYFTGALSDVIVDDSGSAPTMLTPPTSYASVPTGTTQQWRLDDLGGPDNGSVAGTLPASQTLPSGTDPCTYVKVTWPLGLVTTATTMRAVVTNGWSASAVAPAVGASQTSTISLTSNAPDAFAKGLIVYAPVQSRYAATTSPSVTVQFTWSGAAPTSTFTIA